MPTASTMPATPAMPPTPSVPAADQHHEPLSIEPREPGGTRRLLARIARMTLGTVLVAAGVAMLFLPGPGWLTIALGLALLAEDSPLADRLLRRVRSRLPGDAEEQKVWFWVLLSLVSLAGAAISGWYVLLR